VNPAEAQALRSEGGPDYVKHGAVASASLAALIGAAVHGSTETPEHLARCALQQLSNDLTLLAELFSGGGTDLVPDIIAQHILSLAARAEAAAELSDRINEANKSGVAQ